ncbi:hypothetical protein P873_09600 [Arenimonas composti TR7-09 = DSM 18010]|uniref:Uncharacterized protein n=1 Tax=Arenimonas composti TR7-09 = DSM 18010 TaxID=1121013 RepID=A0A091BZL0_9GAMM|nr:hypothetical protein P873_09600 [Arenimonas composti TR7-09 = DSM 18010]
MKAVAASQVVAAFASRLLTLASGWKADPTWPFGLLQPLVVLPMLFHGLVLGPVMVVSICLIKPFRVTPRAKASAIVLALVGAAIAAPSPLMPSAFDAFTWRMSTFSEEQFQTLARDLRAELATTSHTGRLGHLDGGTRERVLRSLRPRHRILDIGDFPVDLNVHENHVSIEWASGLTGGYEVFIADGPEASSGLPPANIHANVSATIK